MREFLSVSRIISFIMLILAIIGNGVLEFNIPIWLGVFYPISLVLSWLEYTLWNKKYHHRNDDFIGYIIMTDIVGNLHRVLDTQSATRIWGIWHFNTGKRKKYYGKRKLKETIITYILKLIVFCIMVMIIYVALELIFV